MPRNLGDSSRTRSGSGTSRTTTSDSGDYDSANTPTNQWSSTFLPSPPSANSNTTLSAFSPGSTSATPGSSSKPLARSPPTNPISALSPIANRVREMDADAMEKYLLRTRSGSQGTPSHNGTQQITGATVQDDVVTATLARRARDLVSMPRRLRPSVSAAQLRTPPDSPLLGNTTNPRAENRVRAGTNPTNARPTLSPIPILTRSTTSDSLRSLFIAEQSPDEDGSFIGTHSQLDQFTPPEPEEMTPTASRRKGLHMFLKPTTVDTANHRRGMSVASLRGA